MSNRPRRSVDELLDFVAASDPAVQTVDHSRNIVYVRARDGRIVSVRVTPDDAELLGRRDGLEFLGGSTQAERSYNLLMIHVDETVNSVSGQPFTEFELDEDGLPRPVQGGG